MAPPVLPLHLGAMHPVESALTLVLAFGPVLVLVLVVWRRSREDRRAEALEAPDPDEAQRPR